MKHYRYWGGVLAPLFLGMFFTVAGVGKILAQSSSYEPFIFPAFMPQPLSNALLLGLPYVEIIIGVLLICGIATKFATSISAFLIACFLASNFYLLSIGVGSCGSCFGVAGGLTVYAALLLDAIMAILVALIFVCYRGNFFNKTPWFFVGHTVTRCV